MQNHEDKISSSPTV